MYEVESIHTTLPFGEAITEERVFGVDPKEVVTAQLSERSSVIGTIALAFSTDPVARWIYPDPLEYIEWFPTFTKLFGGAAFEAGTAFRTPNFFGAALWLPPGTGPNGDGLVELFKASTSGSLRDEVFELLEQMGEKHPEEPHWYLPMIGVEPRGQGHGIGSALMSEALARVDADGLPAYLESSNPRNISLYQRFGFEVIGTIQAGSSPLMYPMYRRAI